MIGNLIDKALTPMNLPIFYIHRGKKNPPEYITYNYIEAPYRYAGMQEEVTDFTILVNIYCKRENIAIYKEQAKDLLKENKFIKVQVPNSFYNEELGLYCIPLNYKHKQYNF